MENNVPIPGYSHIQHHSLVHGVVIISKSLQKLQFRGFQFCHKSHGADIDAENGKARTGGCFCHVQNGTISTKADHKIRR